MRSVLIAAFLVLARCDSASGPEPLGPAAGEADFLPLHEGTVWTYDYSYHDDCSYIRERRSGRYTLRVDSVTETDTLRTYGGEVTADYRTWTNDGTRFDSTDVAWTRPFTAEERVEGVRFFGPGAGPMWISGLLFPRYHPADRSAMQVRISLYVVWYLGPDKQPVLASMGGSCRAGPSVSLRTVE